MKRTAFINILVLCALVLIGEIGGQLYSRWAYGMSLAERTAQYRRDAQDSVTVFERHPYLVAIPKRSVSIGRAGASISTTPMRTRVTGRTPPKPGAITVALVGGSTTFGTKVTDADSWPWLLQEKLGDRYAVINYGVPGYTTAENIIQMALIVPEAKPAIVVFFEGWNDIRNYHWPEFSPDYYSHGLTQVDTLIPTALDHAPFLARAARYSFVMDLLNRAFGAPVGAAPVPPSSEPDEAVDRVYVRNLQTLKALAHRFEMTALFVPQVMNDANFTKKGESRSWTPYIEDAALPTLMRHFNGLMTGICTPDEHRCQYVGEVLDATWGGTDFVDEGHLSRQGGDKFATILAGRIMRFAN